MFNTSKDLWETEEALLLLLLQLSAISLFNTNPFKQSTCMSQRLMKGHLVGRMKTWQQREQKGLVMYLYQKDPQPEGLNLDFVWKSDSIAEI